MPPLFVSGRFGGMGGMGTGLISTSPSQGPSRGAMGLSQSTRYKAERTNKEYGIVHPEHIPSTSTWKTDTNPLLHLIP